VSRYRCPLAKLAAAKPDPEQVKREGWQNQRILVVSPDDHRIDFVERQLLENIGERLYGPKRRG
jgi:hypothetical protein